MTGIPDFMRRLMGQTDAPVTPSSASLLVLHVERQAMARYRNANPNGMPWQALTDAERNGWART